MVIKEKVLSPTAPTFTRRVLIASGHSLFGQGLRSLLQDRKNAGVEVVGMVSDLQGAIEALEQLNPDLIVVDYDDHTIEYRLTSKLGHCAMCKSYQRKNGRDYCIIERVGGNEDENREQK